MNLKPPLRVRKRGLWAGWRGGGRGSGSTQVADDAGGVPGGGEAGAGFVAAEAEDEAVHLGEEIGDFAEFQAQGAGQRLATGNGDGRIGGDQGSGISGAGRQGGGQELVQEFGLGGEIGIAENLPGNLGSRPGRLETLPGHLGRLTRHFERLL